MICLEVMKETIFPVDDSKFQARALELFRYQAKHCRPYQLWVNSLGIDPSAIKEVENIPFLPISFFKSHEIKTGSWTAERIFRSSGTTGQTTSAHHVKDQAFYHKVCSESFAFGYGGNPADYVFLCLLPSYLERNDASLVAMAEYFISLNPEGLGGFYLGHNEQLIKDLQRYTDEGRRVVLLGVTFALLDFAERGASLEGVIVMETGGMKGRRREMVRQEVHEVLCQGLGVSVVHAEYGMTELMSQAYAKESGRFVCPPWMRIMVRDINDPFSLLNPNEPSKGVQGGINVIDLGNIDSCAFIETQDIGKLYANGSFEVLGRYDHSDIRGCNLMVS